MMKTISDSTATSGSAVSAGAEPSTSRFNFRPTPTRSSYNKVLVAGTHTVDVAFTNATYVWWPSCLRNMYLDSLTFSASARVAVPTAPAIPAGFVHQSGTQLLDG